MVLFYLEELTAHITLPCGANAFRLETRVGTKKTRTCRCNASNVSLKRIMTYYYNISFREVNVSSMKQEPVSTTQVSSGRLDSRRALLGDEKYWCHGR